VPLSWEPGDIILDLYEVRPLTDETPYAEGGMGRVNRAWHRGWQIDLAVKSVSPQYLQHPRAVEHFLREAEVWVSRLDLHPNLVFCYYVRVLGGLPRVFVEYVEGGDLAGWVESGRLFEGGPGPALGRILDVAIQFAWGLHAIHTQGLVHQDVKPRNVMMSPDGLAKVTDFGIARARAAASAGDAGGLRPDVTALAGTRSYQSPEQAAGQRLNPATDVWSWGVSVLDLFLGRVERGFGPGALAALDRYVAEGGKDARCPAMPPAVAELLRRCFQARPEDRPRGLLEAAGALREVYAQVTGRPHPGEWVEPAEALADSLNNRALSFYDSLDRRQEAEQTWREALRVDPLHPEATYNLGLLQWRAGQATDAQLLAKLEQVQGGSGAAGSRAGYLLGLVHLERKDFGAAIDALSKGAWDPPFAVERAAALQRARELRTQPRPPADLRMPLVASRPVLATASDYPRLLREARQALTVGEADRAVTLLAAARRESGCGRRPDALELARQLSRFPLRKRFQAAWEKQTIPLHGPVPAVVALSPDGRHAVSSAPREAPRLWDVETGRCLSSLEEDVPGARPFAWSPDGHFLLSGGPDGRVRLREVPTGRRLPSFMGHRGEVTAVAFSPDGRFALSGGKDAKVRLWEIASGRCLRTFRSLGDGPELASRPGGSHEGQSAPSLFGCACAFWLLVTSSAVFGLILLLRALIAGRMPPAEVWSSLFAWGLALGIPFLLWLLSCAHRDAVTALAFSPDGQLALSGSADREVRLWKVSGGRRLGAWPGAAAVTKKLLAYEREPDYRLGAWPGAAAVTAVAWAPDGRLALAGRADGALELWQPSGGNTPRVLEGHKKGVTAVAFSPDGQFFLSGSADQTLRLWEASTGRCLHTFTGHAAVTAVAFSPDGWLALSGGADHTVRVWQLDWELLVN
jgi:WD40 repeat protein